MVSILMPVYNTPKGFLISSLESCLNQTIDDYEIVVIDNGSSGIDTISILYEYASKHTKVKFYRCPRQRAKKNLSVALNYGLTKCKYNLVARMDSDDLMAPDRLEKQLSYMRGNPNVDILGGQILILQTRSITHHPAVITKKMALQTYWFINHPTVMYKRDKILEIGGYKEVPEHFAEDYELWLRALTSGLQMRNLNDVVVHYNLHADNLTRTTEKNPDYFNIMNEARAIFREKNNDIG